MRVLMITHELPTPDNPGSMAPVSRQIDSLREAGIEVDVLELTGVPKFKYIQALPRLWARMGASDLIHAHFGYCGWLARMQLAKPIVVSFMGDDLLGTPDGNGRLTRLSRLVVQIDRGLAYAVDAIIVKSAEMARVVAPLHAHVVPNGVDLGAFQAMRPRDARAALGWAEGKHYVLFPGCPDNPRKGYALALAAVQRAAPQLPLAVELVPLWDVAPERVPLYMNACDAMVMASFVEGSPNVVKEALACNLPIASVAVGDVPEQIANVAGCVLCPRDPGALGDALVGLLTRGQRCEGRAAIERRGLSVANVANQVATIYASVLARRRGRAAVKY